MKEEAKKAELIARTIALKKVQALDSEEHQLRQRREQLTLQKELNVVAARANVYALFEDMAKPDTQLQYHYEPHSTPLESTAAEYIPSSQHEQMHESTAAAKDEQASEQSDINQCDIANSAADIMQN